MIKCSFCTFMYEGKISLLDNLKTDGLNYGWQYFSFNPKEMIL